MPASMIESGSDERLWSLVLQRDAGAFEQVVARHQRAVAAVAFGIVREFAACQDIAQETFLIAWRDCARLSDTRRLGAWLCGIARNVAREALRRRTNSSEALSSDFMESPAGDDPADATISAEEQSLVQQALEDLPDEYREALVLFYHEDHSVRDVARALDVSEDAAKQRLSRGRAMLRDRVADVVEGVLKKARPGRAFTASVMAALAASGSASSASASMTVAGSMASVATVAFKTATVGGAAAGIAGGVLGAAGGLGGAWLGTWVPQQLAPTLTERELLRRSGRRMLTWSLVYGLFLLALSACFLVPNGWIAYVIGVALATLVFVPFTIASSLRMQREIRELRMHSVATGDENFTAMRSHLFHPDGRLKIKGRQFTSTSTLLGLPLIDIQFCAPVASTVDSPVQAARGWIALGDRADGVLFAYGGRARGLIAIGGIAFGVVALGGVSLGILSLGGAAIGLWSFGGAAVGHSATGGAAIAWHDASGGAAIAWHLAFGGAAIAGEMAVGGVAIAPVTNTDAARAAVAETLSHQMMTWQLQHQGWFIAIVVAISIVPVLLMPLFYRRTEATPSEIQS